MVFRKVLETERGVSSVQSAEAKTQELAMKKYGSYTNYRASSENDDFDFEGIF